MIMIYALYGVWEKDGTAKKILNIYAVSNKLSTQNPVARSKIAKESFVT